MGVTLSMPAGYVWPDMTRLEIAFGSLLYGWQLGFGFLTGRNIWRLTTAMRNPWRSPFAWMCWGEFTLIHLTSLWFFTVVAFKDSATLMNFWSYFFIIVVWTFMTQLLLQIICNRIALVETVPRRAKWIKWTTLCVWGFFNLTVFVEWIPAKMMVSEKWVHANDIWDRIEKGAYLLIDMSLNAYFIFAVKKRLVDCGMQKYARLIRFNIRIMCVSVAMDVVFIAMVNVPSLMVYLAWLCVTYTVKLNIELALGKLILVIAQEPSTDIRVAEPERATYQDVLDPYSIRHLQRRTGPGGAKVSTMQLVTDENGRDSACPWQRRSSSKQAASRSLSSTRDVEASQFEDIEVEYEFELRSAKGDSFVMTPSRENLDDGGDGIEPSRPQPVAYQVEVNGNKAGGGGQHPNF